MEGNTIVPTPNGIEVYTREQKAAMAQRRAQENDPRIAEILEKIKAGR
jgi:hypothetical protein